MPVKRKTPKKPEFSFRAFLQSCPVVINLNRFTMIQDLLLELLLIYVRAGCDIKSCSAF